MKKILVISFLILISFSCSKEDNNQTEQTSLATVSTAEISNIDFTSVSCGGNVTMDGGETVTSKGVCWSTSANPTINDDSTNDGTGTGEFISAISNLESNTTYYVRAYAINSVGVSYGDQKEFITLVEGNSGTYSGETIFVTGGTFEMGEANGFYDQIPVHTVSLNSFSIGRHEVTNAEYANFLNEIDTSDPSIINGYYINIYASNIYDNGTQFVPNGGRENLPIEHVTWVGANAFCEHYGGRLPTEAEWEFAAKGGNNSNGYVYSGSDSINDVAWYVNNSGGIIHQIATKNANELGIYDMSGNAIEWVNDWYDENYYSVSPTNNPQGPTTGTTRVARGGAYGVIEDYCTTTLRYEGDVYYTGNYIGFRIAFD